MTTKTNIGIICGAGLTALLLGGCTDNNTLPPTDHMLGEQIAAAIIAACPMAAPNDEQARFVCAANLTENKFLPSVMNEPFLWGGQTAGTSYHPEESQTSSRSSSIE